MPLFEGDLFARDLASYPFILVDVGARGGIHTRWQRILPTLRVLAFEPQGETDENDEESDRPPVEYARIGLHDETGTRMLYVTQKPDGSSILEPNHDWLRRFGGSDRYKVVAVDQITVDTLDRQLALRGNPGVDFVKVDTQGTELAVLRGGQTALSRSVVGVEVEVNFAPRYHGQCMFCDIDAFLRSLGFQLFDIEPRYWKRAVGVHFGKPKGQLVYGNALFLRDTNGLGPLVASARDTSRARAIVVHAICVALVYGYLDLSREIFDVFIQLFSPEEKEAFGTWTGRHADWTSRVPSFRGRKRIARFLYGLSRLVEPVPANGVRGGEPLGNT